MRTLGSIPLVAALTLAGHFTSLSVAPAAVSNADVSDVVAVEERSAHFAAVNRRLELGGVLYGYIDIDGDVARGGAALSHGILVRSFTPQSLKQQVMMGTMSNPVTIGLLASMAIPAFQKVRANSQEKTIQNNLRQFSVAAQQHMLETGKKSVNYADVVGPEEGKYVRELKPVAGEDYESLVVKEGDEEISVTMSNGKMISVRM